MTQEFEPIELAPKAQPVPDAPALRRPADRLDPRALPVMRINQSVTVIVGPLLALGIGFVLERWLGFGMAWVYGAAIFLFITDLALTFILPQIDYRNWYYEIREDEVDTLHGIWMKERRIVPMSRIQHVNVNQGPVQRRYGLATVEYSTAAGVSQIPQLDIEKAAEVRDQIAALAKVHDDL